jgi:hypothetical protein
LVTNERLDSIARALATTTSRRRSLLGSLGIGLATVVAAFSVQARSAKPTCKPAGAACTMWVPCCTGLICATLNGNPNAGFCEPGVQTVATPQPTRTPRPTKTPKPTGTAKAVRQNVKVKVDCRGGVDKVKVINRNKKEITVTSVDALKVVSVDGTPVAAARSVSVIIPAGKSRVFRFHRPPLVSDGENATVEVVTSVGNFVAKCKDKLTTP